MKLDLMCSTTRDLAVRALALSLAVLSVTPALAWTDCYNGVCLECPVDYVDDGDDGYFRFERSITCYECDWNSDYWTNELPPLKNTGCTVKISRTDAKGMTSYTFTYRDSKGTKQTIKYNWADQEGTDDFIYNGHVCNFWWDCLPFGVFLTVDDVEYQYVLASKSTSSVRIPEAWKRARVLRGAWGEGCGKDVEGVCELKLGKANKKGLATVSLKIKKFDGKSISYGSTKVDVTCGDGEVTAVWAKKRYQVEIDSCGAFSGEPIYGDARPCCAPNSVWSGDVGGSVDGYHYLAVANDWDEWWDYYQYEIIKAGKLNEELCTWFEDPDGMEFVANGKKWVSTPSEYARSFKLTYNPETGLFKGTMKVAFGPYCTTERLRAKCVSLKVNGVYMNGELHGLAKYKSIQIPVHGE